MNSVSAIAADLTNGLTDDQEVIHEIYEALMEFVSEGL